MVPEVGFKPPGPYGQGILSQSIPPIDHTSGYAPPYRTTQKILIQSPFTSFRFMVIDADNVDCCEKISHGCPTDRGSHFWNFEVPQCCNANRGTILISLNTRLRSDSFQVPICVTFLPNNVYHEKFKARHSPSPRCYCDRWRRGRVLRVFTRSRNSAAPRPAGGCRRSTRAFSRDLLRGSRGTGYDIAGLPSV